jgi:hypothetical protein
MKLATVAVLALICAGCDKPAPVQTVNIKASDYCDIARKITWVPEDTKPTITGVRKHNAAFDSRCGIKGRPTG